jgi:hypothetical protein
MNDVSIHPVVIDDGAQVGAGSCLWHWVHQS